MIFLMTELINSQNQPPVSIPTTPIIKSRRGVGGGRKKIDPEIKKLHKEQSNKKYKQQRRIWQAYTDDEIMNKSAKIMKQLGFRKKHQLLEWLLERGERSLARKGEGLKLD